MQSKFIEKYFFFSLLAASFIFTFFIFRPFWVVLVLGVSFSVVLEPVYAWLLSRRFPPIISSLLTVMLFIIILCGPLLAIGAILVQQSQNLYHLVTNNGSSGQFLDSVSSHVSRLLPTGVNFDARARAGDFVSFLSSNIDNIFTTTISAFFSFILLLIIIFNFLKDGKKWRDALVILSPLADTDDERIINRLAIAIKGVVVGNLFVAFVQGVLMGLGLFIFGVPNPAIWGVVASAASLIPTIGTSLISVPAVIFLFATGHTGPAIGLGLWAMLLVGLIDNFLNPFVVGSKTNVPPLLVLFSVLGGVSLIGPVGVLVGPLAVSLLYTLITIYRSEYRETKDASL